MSPPTGWVCSGCRRQLRLAQLRPAYLQVRRSFVSLQDINTNKNTDKRSGRPAKDGEEPENVTSASALSSRNADPLVPDVTPDALLEKLFKSTGREPPASPFMLRYSQRLSQVSKRASGWGKEVSEEPREGDVEKLQERYGQEGSAKSSQEPHGEPFVKQPNKSILLNDPGKSAFVGVDIEDAGEAVSQDQEIAPDKSSVQGQDLSKPSTEEKKPKHKRKPGTVQKKPKHKQKLGTVQRKPGTYSKEHTRINALWLSYNLEIKQRGSRDNPKISEILTELLQVFVESNDSRSAAEVWRLIQAQESSPSLKQWSIMLELARKQRDMSSVDTIWRNISAIGLFPDNIAWSTYISAVGAQRSHRLTHTLTELESHWDYIKQNPHILTDDNGNLDRAQYLPSVFPYNAAIESVIWKQNESHLRHILSRMDHIGVQPDITTFNTLLKRAVAGHEKEAVQQILQEMKSRGIEPDKVTVTTLVGERLRMIGEDDDPESVASSVKKLFEELGTQGIEPAPHTYTTALSTLLGREKPHTIAARAVVQHMEERGMESIHTNTVMISHYLTSDPPDRIAADSLVQRAKARETPVDRIFFDRVIEGYAWLGETDRMLDCIRYMPKIRRMPGWYALWRALQHLSEMQYYDVCEEIVNDIEQKGGAGYFGAETQTEAEPFFWNLVAELRSRGLISLARTEARNRHQRKLKGAGKDGIQTSSSTIGEDNVPPNTPLPTTSNHSAPNKNPKVSQDHQGWGAQG